MVPHGLEHRKSSSRDKFKELAQIGTELHQVVESNEVSQSADDSLQRIEDKANVDPKA
jgi:hypothetical protein